MSLYLASSANNSNGAPAVSRRGDFDQSNPPPSPGSFTNQGNSSPSHSKVSITNHLDGTTLKTTERTNPDGSLTVTKETTDPQGNRYVETTEYAACAPSGSISTQSASPPPSVINVPPPQQSTMLPPPQTDTMMEPPSKDEYSARIEGGGQDDYNNGQDLNKSAPASMGFWTRRNKILVGLAVLAIIGVAIAIIVVATSKSGGGGDSGPSSSTEGISPEDAFEFTWPSKNGVIVSAGYEIYSVATDMLCAEQCLARNAPTGLFRPSAIEGNLCVCEFSSQCLDPSISIEGGLVFSNFDQPGQCGQSLCDTSPNDPVCDGDAAGTPTASPQTPVSPPQTPAPVSTPPPTPLPTPTATPPLTPPPTASPPAPTPPSGSLQASVYFLQWYGATDENENCEEPTPGMLISCGDGGMVDIINSTRTAECAPVGSNVICAGAPPLTDDDFWALLYGCIGTTTTEWSTKVVALPDASVACSSNGAAGTSIFLGQRCPGPDNEPNFDLVQCDPSSAAQTGQTSGLSFCQTFVTCGTGTCDLSTPDVAAEIPPTALLDDCLFTVTGGGPPTPAPTPAAGPTPTSDALSAVYQAQWVSVVFPEGSCDEPTPGLRATCGQGGEILILDTTAAVDCNYNGDTEVVCTSEFDEDDFWALVYECKGTTDLAWTTSVDITPDLSIQCSDEGITGSAIVLEQRCPGQESGDPNQVECDPSGALFTTDDGTNFCRTIVECEGTTCQLATPDLRASIPLSAISDTCLFTPS